MKKYNLSDDKIKRIARLAVQENGESVVGKEVSLMANLFELQTKYSDIYTYIREGGWFSKASYWMDNGSATAKAIATTKDVLVNGNRQFPAYINEHDSLSDIKSVSNNGKTFDKNDRSKYKKNVTIIKNRYGSTYTFYEFPSSYSDPFGYTAEAYKKVGNNSSSNQIKNTGLISQTEEEYINKIAEAAQKACKRYGYLPSVLIGQSCLENGYGIRSYWDNPQIEALLNANNMVGIKSELLNSSWNEYTVWQGESLRKDTPEEYDGRMVTIKDNFRVYDTIERSFCDFLLFLKYASNYGKGGVPKYGDEVLSIKDPSTLISTVASRGYATGSTYPTSVMRIVNKHKLTKYDDLSKVTASNYVPGGKIEENKMNTNIKKIENKTIIDITASNKSEVPASRGNNPIEFIVIHYLGVPNADNPYLYGGGYGGHYNIKRDGSIYLAADPRTAVVWQCGGGLQGSGGHSFYQICTNYNSIGIECGVAADTTAKELSGDSDLWYFTEETQESLVFLVSKLMDEYGISIDHVIRHYDVTGKICPNPYVKNNGRKTSWTWDQFKANLAQYRKDGTITIPSGKNSTTIPATSTKYPAVPFAVTVLIDDLNMRQGPSTSYTSNGYTKKGIFTIVEVSGDWGKLKSGAGWIYLANPNYCTVSKTSGEAAPAPTAATSAKKTKTKTKTKTALTNIQKIFLDEAKKVVDMFRTGGWKYGDSHSVIPCDDKKTSCDRLVARTLYNLGFTDQRVGGETCGTLDSYLTSHGWKKVTKKKDIKPGAVIATMPLNKNYIDHIFIVKSYNKDTDTCDKYDTGSNERIRYVQPYKNVKLIEWSGRKFYAAYNLPDEFVLPKDKSASGWVATGTATATTDDLNVRQTPNGNILRQVNRGNRFEVDGTSIGKWVHVNVAGTIGYIHQKYIKYD